MEIINGGLVLLDATAGEQGDFDRSVLERLGHPVFVCHGPDEGKQCPLLAGIGCETFEQAHGIVFELDLDREQHRDVVNSYRNMARPDVPIRVLVRPGQAERYAEFLQRFETWSHEPNVGDLDGFASEVEAADRFTS